MSSNNVHRVSKSTKRTSTCDMCKSRHQKCNGTQPRCSNCELRNINCSYHNVRAHAPDLRDRQSPLANFPLTEKGSQPGMSVVEWNQIYSQVFDEIVHRLQLQPNQYSGLHSEASNLSRPCNAGLPSLHQEVSTVIDKQVIFNNQQLPLGMDSQVLSTDHIKDSVLERDLGQVRKILTGFLPSKEKSQHLLDLFFLYQNSVFYVCNQTMVQAQLVLMYTDPDQISISWFCQMFLIFAIAVQFDDLDDGDGESYRETSQKYLDDAIDENPQDTLWVTRAMLLFCFYQPPTKWTSIWIYLDAAIRGAQRFQLDLGQNMSKELSDEEYKEWRQLWLTIISFDRWVAISLGRLPRIKESISRDPIFKDLRIESGLIACIIQNHITSLAVISGYILRDIYFSKQYSLSRCRELQNELEQWISGLPDPLQQQVLSGAIPELSLRKSDAMFNVHFMYHGAWILLLRPSIFRLVKLRTTETNLSGSIVSVILSDARICIDHAFQVISTSSMMLSMSLTPRRSFMPLFFLVNAAYVVILGAVWKLKQSQNSFGQAVSCDQSQELSAIDESIKVLDFCGQRSTFARKYSILIRGLRQKLNNGQSNAVGNMAHQPSIFSPVSSLVSTHHDRSLIGSPQSLVGITPQSQEVVQDPRGSIDQDTISASIWSNKDIIRSHHPSLSSIHDSIQPWFEDFESFNLSDLSSNNSASLLHNSNVLDFYFQEEMPK